MIHVEGRLPECVRVVGVLQSPLLRILFAMLGGGRVALDLSGVYEAEADAVRLIAQLSPDTCQLVDCPGWLDPWIERERRSSSPNLAALEGQP